MISRLFTIVVALSLVTSAGAQSVGPYPGKSVDSRTLRVQEKVENLFVSGQYERAYTIYRHDLAPIGDKYAQYMVGYMHLMGLGVEEDPLVASAWYRLAAERASSEFLLERDRLLGSMSDVDRVRSDNLYLDLRKQYSDAVLLLRLIREDLGALGTITGSRTMGGASPVVSVDARSGESMAAAERVRRLKSRIESRLNFMAETLDIDDVPDSVDSIDLDEIQAKVDSYVTTITDREVAAAQTSDR